MSPFSENLISIRIQLNMETGLIISKLLATGDQIVIRSWETPRKIISSGQERRSHTSDLRDSHEYIQKQVWENIYKAKQVWFWSNNRVFHFKCSRDVWYCLFLLKYKFKLLLGPFNSAFPTYLPTQQFVYTRMSLKSRLWVMRTVTGHSSLSCVWKTVCQWHLPTLSKYKLEHLWPEIWMTVWITIQLSSQLADVSTKGGHKQM